MLNQDLKLSPSSMLFLFHNLQGFESALMCIQSNNSIDPVTVTMEEHSVNKIKKLRDMATALVASHSGMYYYWIKLE